RRKQDAERASGQKVHLNQPTDQEKSEELRQKIESEKGRAEVASASREAQRLKETKEGGDSSVKTAAPATNQRVRIRLIPIWLRLVLLVAFMFISVTVGAIVGYGIIGGGKVSEVFQQSTWTHIIDLVDKGK
ncbi:DNA-directed RNA polymerase subunit beta, partial [Neobacillus drentensis]|uniref:DNA-directed RNA polymerase subunit beta n=1 Tax=Neobacillus drentensis TaxID=220684 RepID=UPI003000249E